MHCSDENSSVVTNFKLQLSPASRFIISTAPHPHILTYLQHQYFAIFLKISLQLFSCRKVKFVQSYTFIETCCWNWNENIGFTFRFLVQAISKHIKGRNYEWMRNSKQSQFVEKEKLQTATTWSKKHSVFLHFALHKNWCIAVLFSSASIEHLYSFTFSVVDSQAAVNSFLHPASQS